MYYSQLVGRIAYKIEAEKVAVWGQSLIDFGIDLDA